MPEEDRNQEGFISELNRKIATLEAENKKLAASRDDYKRVVEDANSIILRMDTTGKIIFLNAYGQRFFGYYENEILGQNVIGTIVPQTDHAGKDLAAMIEDIGKNPERHSINENENIRCNGEVVRILWTNRAILDAEGNIREIISIGNDITHLDSSTK